MAIVAPVVSGTWKMVVSFLFRTPLYFLEAYIMLVFLLASAFLSRAAMCTVQLQVVVASCEFCM